MAKKQKPVTVPVSGQQFKDGTPVTPEQWENESSQAAMDRAEAIDEAELDEEIRILDELREHPERSEELSHKGGISYPIDDVLKVDRVRSSERARRQIVAKEEQEIERLMGEPSFTIPMNHDCFEGGRVYYKNFDDFAIGEHSHWEFKLMTCKICRRKYLRAFLESDGYSHSGRWYLGRIPMDTPDNEIDPETSLERLANHDKVFYGGSYWGHAGKWSKLNDFPDLYGLRVAGL